MHTLLAFAVIYPEVPIALLLVLFASARWFTVSADRERTEWLLAMSALAIPATMLAEGAAKWLSRLRPLKYDLYIYRIDSIFGQPSFRLGSIAYRHLWIQAVMSATYGFLSVAIVGTFVAYLYLASKSETIQVAKAFIVNLFAAVPIYLLIPVCGPALAFPHFPKMPEFGSPHPIALAAAPNGVPSVHTSTALLVMFFLWRWKWGRPVGVAFLLLTIAATLGSGQHYGFDLFCAVPYAWVVWSAAHWKANAAVAHAT